MGFSVAQHTPTPSPPDVAECRKPDYDPTAALPHCRTAAPTVWQGVSAAATVPYRCAGSAMGTRWRMGGWVRHKWSANALVAGLGGALHEESLESPFPTRLPAAPSVPCLGWPKQLNRHHSPTAESRPKQQTVRAINKSRPKQQTVRAINRSRPKQQTVQPYRIAYSFAPARILPKPKPLGLAG